MLVALLLSASGQAWASVLGTTINANGSATVTVNAGTLVTLNVAVTNTSGGNTEYNSVVRRISGLPTSLTLASFTIAPVSGATFGASSVGATFSGGVLSLAAIDDFDRNEIASYTVTFAAPGGVSSFTAQAEVQAGASASINSNPDATVNITPVADVSTSIASLVGGSASSAVCVGQALTLRFTFTNAGPSQAAGYTRSITVPAGLAATGAVNVYSAGTTTTVGTYNNASGAVGFTAPPATLASGANASVDIVIANVPPTFTSITASSTTGTSTSQGANTGPNSATLTPAVTVLTATPGQPGTISGATAPCAGSSQTYSIATVPNATSYQWSVTGTGWSVASGGTTATATFTVGTGAATISVAAVNVCGSSAAQTLSVTPVVGVPAQPGTISGAAAPCANTSQTYTISPVTGATSYQWTVTGTGWAVTAGGTTTSATLTAGTGAATISVVAQNVCGNSTAQTLSVTPSTTCADLRAVISGPATAPAGSIVYYTITTTNLPTSGATATNLNIRMQLPAGLLGVSLSDGGLYDNVTGLVTWPTAYPGLDQLGVGASVTYNAAFAMPASGTVTGTALASATQTDPDATNNDGSLAAAQVTTTPTQVADVTVSVSGPTVIAPNERITYVVSVGNEGPSTATGVAPTLQLPSGLTGVTLPNGGTYNSASGLITFPTTASLAKGGSLAYLIRIPGLTSGSIGGTASGTTTTTDGDPFVANNNGSQASAQITTTVNGAVAQNQCATPGLNGNIVTTASTIINTYFPGSGTAAANTSSLTLGAAAIGTQPVAAGDLLLVMQMQGADIDATNTSSYGDGLTSARASGSLFNARFNAGQYEYVIATNNVPLTGGTLTISTALIYSYDNATATTTSGQRRFQVIRIPQYLNMTLGANYTVPAWNGRVGGVLAFDVARTLTLGGFTIDGKGRGFRGGAGIQLSGPATADPTLSDQDFRTSNARPTNASKGEGTAGTPRYLNDNGALLDTRTSGLLPVALTDGYPNGDFARGSAGNAGGGGTDGNPGAATPAGNDENSGGGGGSNAGFGGTGGNSWDSNLEVGGFGGADFTASSPSRLIMGGGGGAGTTNNGTTVAGGPGAGFASSGGAGGAIVMGRAQTVSGTGTIDVSGQDVTYVPLNDASGGGGAGGSVLILSANTLANVTVLARGGAGGSNTGGGYPHGPGGSGAGGVAFTSSALNAASNLTSGANGTTFGSIAYGSGVGTAAVGQALTTVTQADAPNLISGAVCTADVRATIAGPTVANPGATVTYTLTIGNNGPNAATGVEPQLQLAPNLAAGSLTLPAGATYDAATGLVTFAVIPSLSVGVGNNQTITVSFVMPSLDVTGTALASAVQTYLAPTNNNGSAAAANVTTLYNRTPVAAAITHSPAIPNSAGQTAITALSATDSDGTIASYTITALPPATQGVLFVNGVVLNTTNFPGLVLTPAQAAQLQFTPNTTYLGNATFTYTATDNGGLVSAAATYTIPVVGTANVATTISGPTTAAAGSTITYTATTTNAGPNPATDAVVTIQLPTGLTGVTATNGTYNATTGLVTFAAATPIANGASVTNTVSFTAPATGPVTGQAASTTSSLDPTPANNNGSAANANVSTTITPSPRVDIVLSAGAPVRLSATTFDIPMTIQVQSVGLNDATNLQVEQQLITTAGGTTAFQGATSRTIVVAPTATGALAGAVNTGYTGAGTGANVHLLNGTTTLPVGQSSTITYTVRVVYPAGSVPTATQFTQAYVSTRPTGPNNGYTFSGAASGATATPPTGTSVDAEASTNSTTLPTPGKSDTPSLTPIRFDNPLAVNNAFNTPNNTTLAAATATDITANDTPVSPNTIDAATVDLNPDTPGLDQTNVPALTGGGTFSVNASGQISYVPANATFTGVATVNYTVRDNAGNISTVATVSVNVGGTAGADSNTIVYSSTGTVTTNVVANDADINIIAPNSVRLLDSGGNRVTSLTVAGGTFTVSGNSIVFDPDGTVVGTIAAQYNYLDALTGNQALSATGTLTITTTNSAPTVADDLTNTPNNTPRVVAASANDTDPNGNASVTGAIDLDPTDADIDDTAIVTGGTFTTVGQPAGSVLFTPVDATFTGIATVSYNIRDAFGLVSTNSATISVNVGPQAVKDDVTASYTATVSTNVTTNDLDVHGISTAAGSLQLVDPVTGLPTTATSVTITGQGTFTVNSPSNGFITFTPLAGANFIGTASVRYVVLDNNGTNRALSSQGTYSVTTTNTAPVANADAANPLGGFTSTTINVVANDTDVNGFATINAGSVRFPGGATSVAVTGGTFTVNTSTGVVTFTPTNPSTFSGSASTTYTVQDALGATSNTATITVNAAGTTLACNSVFYRVTQPGTNQPSNLQRLDRTTTSTSIITYTATTLYNAGVALNALSFNYADGYLYAFGIGNNILYRLSGNGVVQNLGAISGLPATGFNAASADLNGNIYLANDATSTLYRLNVATLAVSSVTLTPPAIFGDMGYNPSDNQIYTTRYYNTTSVGANGLYRINPTTGAVTVLGTPPTTGGTGIDNVGSIFFDAAGTLYAATNEGRLALFDTGTGAVTSIGTATTASQSDGASCVFPTNEIDVVLAAAAPQRVSATAFDVPFTVRVRNTGAVANPNVQVNDFLSEVFPGATLAVSGLTVTTTGNGATPVPVASTTFTGSGLNTALLGGSATLAANATSTITYTVRVTYPSAGAVPTTTLFDQVYASTTSNGPNNGYTLVNGAYVPPASILAADRSTNGATLPATPSGDTPSPTPIRFVQPLALGDNAATAAGVAVTINASANDAAVSPNVLVPGSIRFPGNLTTIAVTGGSFVVNTTTGVVTFTPTAGFSGAASTTYTIQDNANNVSNAATITVNVTPVADVTVALTGPTVVQPNATTGNYTVTFTNNGPTAAAGVTRTVQLPTGGSLSAAQIAALPMGATYTAGTRTIDFGTLTTLANGSANATAFTFAFTAGASAAAAPMTATVGTSTSQGANTALDQATLQVRTNAAPVAQNVTTTAISSQANASAIQPFVATDADGTIASYTILTLPTAAQGWLFVNGVAATANQVITPTQAGQLTFDPAGGQYGNFTFTYSATDNDGLGSNVATYTIPVQNVGPVANSDQNDVPMNTATTGQVILNDSDPELGPLNVSLTLVSTPGFGVVDITSTGAYTYTPNTNYVGPDQFTYRVCDNGGLCATATVFIRVYNPLTACVSGTGNNLVVNPTFAAGNTGFNTTLTYVAPGGNMYPEDTYAVTADVSAYHAAFSGTGRGGAGDNFLAINASPQIKTMYQQTFTVQPNRYYTFSAYFTNLLTSLNLNDPQVGFVINGQSTSGIVAITERSPSGTTAQWVRHSDVWFSGANTTAVFEIRNLTIERSGNDLGIDDVYFGTCNLPPVANVDVQNTPPNTPVTFSLTLNDTDGDGIIQVNTTDLDPTTPGTRETTRDYLEGGIVRGTFVLDDLGNVTFTPVAGFLGTATITYAVQDNNAATSNPATIAVTVQAPVTDVQTSISAPASGSTQVAGQPVTATVVTANNGPATAYNVVQTIELRPGLAATALQVNGQFGTLSGGVITFPGGSTYVVATGIVTFPTLASQAPGAANNVSNTVTFPMPGSGPEALTAAVTHAALDAVPANNVATVNLLVSARFDLLTVINGPATLTAGNQATFSVVTANNAISASAAQNVVQTVQLPTGLMQVFVSNGGTYDATTGVVTFPALSNFAPGQQVVNTISFDAPATGFTATASVTPTSGDINTVNNTASAPATAVAAPPSTDETNPFTTIAASANYVAPGTPVTLTIVGGNRGPAGALGVQVTVQINTGLTFTNLGGGTYDAATGLLTFSALSRTAAPLLPGDSTIYTATLLAPQVGPVLAASVVTSTSRDVVASNNYMSTRIDVFHLADVAIVLAAPATANAGDPIVYTVTTTNLSGMPARSLDQTVQLAPNLTGVTVSGGGSYNATTGLVTLPVVAALPVGGSQSYAIAITAPADITSLRAVATVASTTPETVFTNNTAVATTTLAPAADVTIAVSGPATGIINSPVSYVVTTTNNGPSVAASTTPVVQLPRNLLLINLPTGATYVGSTGLLTLSTLTNLPAGASSATAFTVVMPDVARLVPAARAEVTAATNDRNLTNNFASVSTIANAPTDQLADVSAAVAATSGGNAVTTATPAQSLTFTATFRNNGPNAATSVAPRLALPSGLATAGVVVSNGGTYDPATGLVTWPVLTSVLDINSQVVYTVTLPAPASGPLVATAVVSSATSDNIPANNAASTSVTIDPRVDVISRVAGPATAQPGEPVTYSITTTNNGPSSAANVQTTVTLPAGVTNVVLPVGATQTGNVVTMPVDAVQVPGTSGQQTYLITFTPVPGDPSWSVATTATTATTETSTANNGQTRSTSVANVPPVAYNVVNALPEPIGTTAAAPRAISPLVGTDANGSVVSYTIAALPPATQGVLYVNGVELTAANFPGLVLTVAQATQIQFDPATGFMGNVFFSYTATDNLGAVSLPALYQIPVGRDNNSFYTNGPVRGGQVAYQNGDNIADLFDANGGSYNSAGNVTDTGTRSVVLLPTSNPLPPGVGLNPTTGQVFVSDRLLLVAGTYTIDVQSVDQFSGTNPVTVTFQIGNNPLPVTLTRFTAQGRGTDAVLAWATASEKDAAYFAVERSLDGGRTFAQIGRREAAGTTTVPQQYTLTDAGVGRTARTVYYRLRQVDFDGTTAFSNVESVTFTGKQLANVVRLFPNPATTSTTLDLTEVEAGTYAVHLYDATGRLVQTATQLGGTQQPLDLTALPTGSYVVRVTSAATGFVATQRVVKE